MPSEAIKKLEPFFEKADRLHHLLSLLNFDVETTAPADAIEAENDLIAFYSSEAASISKDPEFIRLVKQAKGENLNDAQALLIDDALEEIEFMEKIPLKTYEEWEKATYRCIAQWKKAKNASDWSIVEPYFKKLVEIKREEAKLLAKPEHETLYDAFLSQYEKGQKEKDVDAVFEPLKKFLVENLPHVLEKQSKLPMPKILPHDVDHQAHLSIGLLKAIGYDLNRGVLRETEHPFSDNIARYDCRVTTHYHVDDWRSSMYSVIHEGGHSIQFQNWPDYQFENHVDGRASAALCETHSRFYENLIGRSRAFAPTLLGLCREHLGEEFLSMSEEEFFTTVNQVTRSLVRTEADEYTYCLHIILRYELERDLINGKIDVEDLPKAWNAKYKEYLGIDVPDDAHGILQDVHWYQGSFGYFPSYALGNIYGAQILHRMKKDLDVDKAIQNGDLSPVLAWLRENDFAYDYLNPSDWILKVTGEAMNPTYFKDYLKEKFF